MTDNASGYAPPPNHAPPAGSPPPTPRTPLRRTPAGERVLGGVAAGIARWLGIDPILIRVAFVVLALFGGGGVVLYLAGWLFLPEEGQEESSGERFVRDNTALAVVVAVVLALTVVGPALAWDVWGDGPGFLGVALAIAAVAVVVAIARRDASPGGPPSVPAGAPAAAQAPFPASAQGATQVLPAPVAGPSASPPRGAAPAAPARPPREKSVLGGLTVGVALVVVGVLVALDLAGAVQVGAVSVLAAALLVVAAGLLVGTLVGRSRGLIALGVALVLVLLPLAALPRSFRAGDGAGERQYAPTELVELRDSYRLGAGELTLDLTGLDLAGTDQTVEVSLGVGRLVVVVPEGTDVVAEAHVGMGSVRLPDAGERGGLGIDRTWASPPPTNGDGSLQLDLEVGLGEVVVDAVPVTEVTR